MARVYCTCESPLIVIDQGEFIPRLVEHDENKNLVVKAYTIGVPDRPYCDKCGCPISDDMLAELMRLERIG